MLCVAFAKALNYGLDSMPHFFHCRWTHET